MKHAKIILSIALLTMTLAVCSAGLQTAAGAGLTKKLMALTAFLPTAEAEETQTWDFEGYTERLAKQTPEQPDYTEQLAPLSELSISDEALDELLEEWERNIYLNPIAAAVIGHEGGEYWTGLTLNVGSSQGIAENMAVVADSGLVGVTCDVTENTCRVRCVISGECAVAALIQSSRDQGMVLGAMEATGEPLCFLEGWTADARFQSGGLVVTSGVGVAFLKGVPIGYIRDSGTEEKEACVALEPIVDFRNLEYVTVYRYCPDYAE